MDTMTWAKVEDCDRVGGKTRENLAEAVCQELRRLEGLCLRRESYRNQAENEGVEWATGNH